MSIYYITDEIIKNKDVLTQYIYPNMKNNYYWSDDWSVEFYIELAYAGFISVSTVFEDRLVLLPEIQFEYAVLDFEDLHVGKKVNKLLKSDSYKFTINKKFEELLDKIELYHQDSWLIGEYKTLVKNLRSCKNNKYDFEIMSIELSDSDDNLVAGELGYKIGSTYTSLTGFFDKRKEYNNYGKLQLVLLAKYLEKNSYTFWNLGHPYMEYKTSLGAKIYGRKEFLKRWFEARN
jgi:Leu/Phe-tRNA-protein transferase